MADVKEKFKFLNVQNMKKEDIRTLATRLKRESEDIKMHFARIDTSAISAIEKSGRASNGASVEKIKYFLDSCDRDDLAMLIKPEHTISEAMIAVGRSKCWSFFDYKLFEQLIHTFCKDEPIIQEFEDYKLSFVAFCKRRLAEVPDDCFDKKPDTHPNSKIYIKIDEKFFSQKVKLENLPLEFVKDLEYHLSVLLGVPYLELLSIEKGCIELTFRHFKKSNPLESMETIDKITLAFVGVKKIYCGTISYNLEEFVMIPPSQLPENLASLEEKGKNLKQRIIHYIKTHEKLLEVCRSTMENASLSDWKRGKIVEAKEMYEKSIQDCEQQLANCSALIIASKNGDIEMVSQLLKELCHPDMPDENGWTALMMASQHGHTKIASLLIEHGTMVNLTEDKGQHSLMIACQDGHTETALLLLKCGANVNQQDNDGWSPLMMASKNGHTGTVIALLENGADVNMQDSEGQSSLVIASENKHYETASTLLEKGAIVSALVNGGSSNLTLFEQLVLCNAELDTLAVTLEAFKQGFIGKKDLKALTVITSKVSIVERRKTLLKCAYAISEEKLAYFANYFSVYETEAMAMQAVRDGLIKTDVLKSLSSLHLKVPFSRRYRYVLQCLHKSLVRKLENFKNRVMIIVAHELIYESNPFKLAKDAMRDNLIDKSVLDYLFSLYPQVSSELEPISKFNLRKLLEDSVKNKGLLKHIANGVALILDFSSTVSRTSENLLGPEDFLKLYELLSNYSYCWENIGKALGFGLQDLNTIEASPLLMIDAPKSYLARLLEDWLLRKLEHTLPPSVDSLQNALNSRIVRLGFLVKDIKRLFFKHPYDLITFESSSKHNTVYIKEGLSILLEIQVKPSPEETTYQWLKDGKELCHDSSKEPILCIPQVDIDMDGCEISCQFQPTVNVTAPSFSLNVSCELDEFRTLLASMYLAQPEVPADTWPPVARLKYINLALVRQQRVDYNSESARLTIRGDVDDVLQDKKIIAYNEKEFYCNLSSGQLVLIEGRPGSGKTTFVHKLTQDWATQSGGAIRLLFLLSLRVLNTLRHPDLSDILMLFEELQVSRSIIEQRSGKGVCFIFDGLDEFSPDDGQSSIVHHIINKTYLPHSIVIVASRPAAIAKLRHKANSVIEVVGFVNKQIHEYFDRYPFSTSTKSAELIQYLEFHPNILHLCYLPIQATLVAFLFEVLGRVPRTETEMYTHFTRLTLIRNLTKDIEFEPVLIDLHSLTGEEGLCFKTICLLAFEKTILNKQVLDQSEVSSHFQVKRSIDSSLGLITVDRTAGLYGYKNIYTFMHLTFQEFLAAYHITTLHEEVQIKLIQEHGDKDHMLVVWKFFCGLITIGPSDNRFKSILSKSKGRTLFHIQCCYESQQDIACAHLLNSVNYHFKLEDEYLNTPHFTGIGYVTNSTSRPTKLSFLNCGMNTVAIDALPSELQDKAINSIDSLRVMAPTADSSQMECMNKLLENLKSLKSLSLEAKEVQPTPSAEVSNNKLLDLTELFVINVDTRPLLNNLSLVTVSMLRFKGDIKVLVNCLPECKSLKELDLSGVDISDENAKYLAKSLKDCNSLERINLTDANIPSSGVEAILRSLIFCHLKVKDTELPKNIPAYELLKILEQMHNLQSLEISISIDRFDFLSECAQKWKRLKELNVSLLPTPSPFSCSSPLHFLGYSVELESLTIKNYVPGDALLVCPDHLQNLENLDLYKSMISSLKGLPLNLPSLQKLQIDSALIGEVGIKTLIENLEHCSNLQILSLSSNDISSNGCVMLAAILHRFTNLEKLNLEDNGINTAGAHEIISSLKNCSHFQELNLLHNPCHYMKIDNVTFSVLLSH